MEEPQTEITVNFQKKGDKEFRFDVIIEDYFIVKESYKPTKENKQKLIDFVLYVVKKELEEHIDNKSCDVCGASQSNKTEVCGQISVKMESEKTGEKTMEPVVLCNDCYKRLTKFFGKYNPFTGKEFTQIDDNGYIVE